MSDLRKDLIDFAGTLERHGDEDAAALVLRAGASIAELEAENLRLRDMLRRVHRQLGLGMSLAGEIELSKIIIEALEQGE